MDSSFSSTVSSSRVLGIGGSLRAGSRTEQVLRVALAAAEEAGATTSVIAGSDLVLPFYDATAFGAQTEKANKLIEAVRAADGIIVVSPGYHGALSGLVKNALDYVEELRRDVRPYLDGRAVGTIAVAEGSQAAVTTLQQLRTIAHSLRGWPTPLGAAVDTSVNARRGAGSIAGGATDGAFLDDKTRDNLRTIGHQVTWFARSFHRV